MNIRVNAYFLLQLACCGVQTCYLHVASCIVVLMEVLYLLSCPSVVLSLINCVCYNFCNFVKMCVL